MAFLQESNFTKRKKTVGLSQDTMTRNSPKFVKLPIQVMPLCVASCDRLISSSLFEQVSLSRPQSDPLARVTQYPCKQIFNGLLDCQNNWSCSLVGMTWLGFDAFAAADGFRIPVSTLVFKCKPKLAHYCSIDQIQHKFIVCLNLSTKDDVRSTKEFLFVIFINYCYHQFIKSEWISLEGGWNM